MKKKFGITHAIAKCENCGWENQSHKNAQATAAIHAKKRKHKVWVEFAQGGYYDGREIQPMSKEGV